MGLKYNTREQVLKSRSGGHHLVLLPEIGLVVDHDDITKVHAFFSETKKAWIIQKKPYYSSGGWGSGSRGDRAGSYIHENTVALLRCVSAKILESNAPDLSDLESFSELQERTKKIIKLKAQAKKLGLDPDLSEFEESGLELKPYKKYSFLPLFYHPQDDDSINSGRGYNPSEVFEKYSMACEVFKTGKGKTTQVETYKIGPNEIRLNSTLVAFRTKEGKVILNSQRLPCSEFESKVLGGQSLVQKLVREIADMTIPINVLDSAGLSLSETRIIEQGPEEDFTIQGTKTHFTGALLLENSGRKFLMDLDRREVQHGIWNPFFCEVAPKAESIGQAYDSMIPNEVKEAMDKGIEVLRQGEWFFINTGKTQVIQKNEYFLWESEGTENLFGVRSSNISHGKGRPNSLLILKNSPDESLNGLACGIVTHSGREHAPLCLGGTITEFKNYNNKTEGLKTKTLTEKSSLSLDDGESMDLKLWKVVPNTTVSNFTITGDID